MSVLDEVNAERQRQIDKGYDAAHDDKHTNAEIFEEALAYLSAIHIPGAYPDHLRMCKPVDPAAPNAERQRFIRAIALLVSEVERVDRLNGYTSKAEG